MSFSAEMRDFLNAYKTGQSINASRTDQDYKEARTRAEQLKTDRDNDPDTLKTAKEQATATLNATKDRMATSAAARADAAARTGIASRSADANIDAAKSLSELRRAQAGMYAPGPATGSGLYPPGAINPATPNAAPAPAAAGALPIGPSTLNADEDAYADGGLVDDDKDGLFYEAGGMVDDDNDAASEPDSDADDGVLNTAEVPTPANAPTDVSAQSRQTTFPQKGLDGVISPQLVDDARNAGMTWGIKKAGLDQSGAVKSPAAMLKAKQIAQGMGGLTEQEMQAAKQAVDPEGKLSESQRNLAALGSVYQFWANKGEPERAQRVAFQMLQYYRGASQRYAAIAAKAAEGGNMDLATKAALKAYANVPDGRDLELMPNPDGGLMYSYTDEKGDVIVKGVATPQQLAASAMGLATGGFDKAILAAAGAMQAPPEKGKGGTQSSADRAKEGESVNLEVEKLQKAWSADKKNEGKPLDDNMWSEVANAATHIYQQNPKATANEVAHAAYKMLSMGDDPEKPGFKVKPGEDGKPNIVDFGGKLKVQLDDQQLEAILNSRAVKVKAAVDKINKDMEDSDKPGFIDKAIDAGKGAVDAISKMDNPITAVGKAQRAIGSGAVDMLEKFYGVPVSDMIPDELKQRVGSDLRKIDSLVRSKYSNPMQNPGAGAIPVDEGDRPL